MDMAALAHANNPSHHGKHDHWGRRPSRGNDDEEGLIEDWGVKTGGRDFKTMMRKRPRSPSTTITTTTTAQCQVAQRNKSELISSQCRRNSQLETATNQPGNHQQCIQGTKISHQSSGPATAGTRLTSGQEQETHRSMCQNFIGRRDSERTSGRGLQVASHRNSPSDCNAWDSRLRSPDRGRDPPVASWTSERTQRERDIAFQPHANVPFERRFVDNLRTRTGNDLSHQHRREETNDSNSRGHHFRSGGSWNDNTLNTNRNDSAPRFEPRQGYGGQNYRNAPENLNSPSIRHENARTRDDASRLNVGEWRQPSDSQQPRKFPPHTVEDRYARRVDGPERPTGAPGPARDFHNASQGRHPERRTHDTMDQRRIAPTRDPDSWQHPERRTNHGCVGPLSSQHSGTRFHHESNNNRCQSTTDADSFHNSGRDRRPNNTLNGSRRPVPVPCHRPETKNGAWQCGQDHEPWRSSELRDFPHSNPTSKSGLDRRPYLETQGSRPTDMQVPEHRRFSETRTSNFTKSSHSPGRDQWHRQETQSGQSERHRDPRQHVESTGKPFVSKNSSRSQAQDQGRFQERQTCPSEMDRRPRQHLESSEKPLGSFNSSHSPGRDQSWYHQRRQTCQVTRDLDGKQNFETVANTANTSADPVHRSGPDQKYRHDHDARETLQPRSNPSSSGFELMPRMRQQVQPAVLTTSCAPTSTSTSPPTLTSPRESPAPDRNPLDSRPGNYSDHTISQPRDRSCESRKREATDTQNLNPPNKRWCNVTRDPTKPDILIPPPSASVPPQSIETSTADSSTSGVTFKQKSNPVASISNQGTTGLPRVTTEDVVSNNSAKSVNENPSIKKTSIGIPMRWLKPQKPKIVQKVKSKEHASREKNVTESRKEEPAPSSPLINRMVTDSEGGSTVSNTRELLATMEKKRKEPKVPTAIVTMQTVDDTSLDSPPRTDYEIKGSNQTNVKTGTKVAIAQNQTETDDEPPLESDDDDDDSSIESSSDESETDDEEVMLWASKMFGVPIPSTMAPASQTFKNERNRERKTVSKKPLKLRLKLSATKTLPGTPSSVSFNRPTNFMYDEGILCKKSKAVQPELSSEENDEAFIDVPMRLAVRGRQKKRKPFLKKLPDISPEELQVDLEQERIEREEEKRIREEAKPLTAAQIREILGEDEFNGGSSSNWVRRSVRQPSRALLSSKPLKALMEGLKNNDPDMVVLKMKKYINDPNAPSVVIDAALEALEENTNCEALYIQNFNEGMRDKQVLHLLRILQSSTCKIWCLNIGENYNVDTETWEKFTKGLRRTKITHMYASEHTITTEMKDEIRETIRENRSKHDMHINPNNLDVIIQCTHCWWNPINAKTLRPYLKKKGYEHILNDKEAQGLRGSTSEAPSA